MRRAGRFHLRCMLSRSCATSAPSVGYMVNPLVLDEFDQWASQNGSCSARQLVRGATATYSALGDAVATLIDGGHKSWDFEEACRRIADREKDQIGTGEIPQPPKEAELITKQLSTLLSASWLTHNPMELACANDCILTGELVGFQRRVDVDKKPVDEDSPIAKATVKLLVVPPAERLSPRYRFFLTRVAANNIDLQRALALMFAQGSPMFETVVRSVDWARRSIFSKPPVVIHAHEPSLSYLPAELLQGGIAVEKFVELQFDADGRWRVFFISPGELKMGVAAAKLGE